MVARNYLLQDKPDAILNIVDGTNLERNLYLTTQLAELGIPMVIAVNMMDVVDKSGDVLHLENLAAATGCVVVEISALKGRGIRQAAEQAVKLAKEAGRAAGTYLLKGGGRLSEGNRSQNRRTGAGRSAAVLCHQVL